MVSTLFTALALIAAGQAETTGASSSGLEIVRGERSALSPPRRAAPRRTVLPARRQD
jgi:hypothetical protein